MLSEAELMAFRRAYEENGFFIAEQRMPKDLRDSLRRYRDWAIGERILQFGGELKDRSPHAMKQAWEGAGRPNFDRRGLLYYSISPEYFEIVRHPFLLTIGEMLLGTKNMLLSPVSNLRYKSCDFPWSFTAPHYDAWYWEKGDPDRTFNFLTFWMPLVAMTHENGGLELHGFNKSLRCDDLTKIKYERRQQLFKHLAPGDLIVLSPYVVHETKLSVDSKISVSLDIRLEDAANASSDTREWRVVCSHEDASQIVSLEAFLAKRPAGEPPAENVSIGRITRPSGL